MNGVPEVTHACYFADRHARTLSATFQIGHYVRMDDLSPGERAFRWVRAELTAATSRPALVFAALAISGALVAIASAITDSVAYGSNFRIQLLVGTSGFGPISLVLLVVASILVLADGLAGGRASPGSPWFYGLACLGALGIAASLVEMISQLTEAGIFPRSTGVGTTTEFYAYTILTSLTRALLAVVPLYVGLTGPRSIRVERTAFHAR